MSHRERTRMRQAAQFSPQLNSGESPATDLRPNVQLRIEQLTIEGIRHSDRHIFAASVQEGLQRLLNNGGMPRRLTAPIQSDQSQAPTIAIVAGARPQAIGRQVADAVYRSLVPTNAGARGATGPLLSRNRGGASR